MTSYSAEKSKSEKVDLRRIIKNTPKTEGKKRQEEVEEEEQEVIEAESHLVECDTDVDDTESLNENEDFDRSNCNFGAVAQVGTIAAIAFAVGRFMRGW